MQYWNTPQTAKRKTKLRKSLETYLTILGDLPLSPGDMRPILTSAQYIPITND